MKSPTDAFEDAEIAREELLESARIAIEDGEYNTLPLVQALVNALEARQSPASTTAADLSAVTRVTVVGPDGVCFERYGLYRNGAEMHLQDDGRTLKLFPATKKNSYRVAAPEGDGGNE